MAKRPASTAFLLSIVVLGLTTPCSRAAETFFSGSSICSQVITPTPLDRDDLDLRRDWGVRLLPDNDPTFDDPEYLAELIKLARPGAVGMDPQWRGIHDSIIDRLDNIWMVSAVGKPVRYTHSGTDANNALFEFAEYAFHQRTGREAKRVQLLHFKNPYAGVNGRISEYSNRYPKTETNSLYEIPSPFVKNLSPVQGNDLIQVEALEKSALEFVRRQVSDASLEIGALFIEPISVYQGLHFFRPEFLLQLRALADDLQVPIFADEVLTGGGRTGKFWAFSHYPGFEPDLITFGKGIGISGIRYIKRTREHLMDIRDDGVRWDFIRIGRGVNGRIYDNTSQANALVILQASQILKRIYEGNLRKNAELTGQYFLTRLREKAKQIGIPEDKPVQCKCRECLS
ncbi:MAG: aminotransferase class III-fold pyridoxal phosphate-dependent enzyme [Proteobacteria bacterium]|nr:MAG: aminotransferase class III-fold pyridoxal phosphate-dependent enzyme [Pseudomonadota bacterium]